MTSSTTLLSLTTFSEVSLSTAIANTSSSSSSSVLSVPEGCVLKQVSQSLPGDSDGRLVPRQVRQAVEILIMGVVLPVFFLTSCVTNSLSMTVFYKQGLKERINMCLFTLSLVDMLYLAVAYGFGCDVPYMLLKGKPDAAGPVSQFFVRSYLLGLIGLEKSSHVVTTVIALERCLCVTRPLLAKTFMSTRTTTIVLWFLLLAVASGVVFSGGMRYDLICVFDRSDNSTFFSFHPSQFYFQNQFFMHLFNGIIFGLLQPVLCTLCVAACTMVTVTNMRKLSAWRKAASSAPESQATRDLTVTRMIVGTSVLFIVCMVPSVLFRTTVFLVPGVKLGGRYENLYFVFARIFQLTSGLNCSFNFFVYYTYGSKFRNTLQEMFLARPCLKSKHKT